MDEEASDEDTDISSDPLHGIQANNRTDVYIFLNIVDFLRYLVLSLEKMKFISLNADTDCKICFPIEIC